MTKGLAPNFVRFGTAATMVLLLFVAGCGKRTGDVTGTVSYRGEPLPSGNVTFFDKSNQVVGNSAITAGKYRIRNLPAGTVTITVTSAPPPNKVKKGMPPPDKDAAAADGNATIPSMYGSPEKSGLTYQVKPGPQKHPIELN